MTPQLTMALGAYIVGAAHYVRDGSSGFYAAWLLTGAVIAIIDFYAQRAALKARET